MLLYLAVTLVVGATTSTAYINPIEDYRGTYLLKHVKKGFRVSFTQSFRRPKQCAALLNL